METSCTYFESGGPGATDETLRLARARAEELGIKNVVVASYSGQTGAKARGCASRAGPGLLP